MKSDINIYISIIILFIFIILYYFMIIYPQKKIEKKINMISKKIKINKFIILKGGIIGKIKKILNKKYLIILINKNTKILIKKKYILDIVKNNKIIKIFKLIN